MTIFYARVAAANFLLIFAWALGGLQAQDLRFTRVAGSEALGPINCLEIDRQGVKWAGTEQGLISINGTSKKIYTANNSNLRDGHINCMAIDAQNNKWLGSYTKGLMSLDATGKFHHYPFADARVLLITDIAIDGLGQVWVSTSQGGIYQLEDGMLIRQYHTKTSKLPSNTVYALGFLPSGILWAGTAEGLCFIEGNKISTFKSLKGIRGLLSVGEQQFAGGLGLQGPVLWRKEGKDWEKISDFCQPLPPLNGMIRGKEFFWITTNEGLLRFNGQSCKRFDHRHGLEFKALTSVAQGEDSTLWVGTAQGQLFTLAKEIIPPKPEAAVMIDSASIAVNTPFNLIATQFQAGTAILVDSATAMKELEVISNYWKKYPSMQIIIEGHTDDRGGQIENWKLSRARAEQVGDWLKKLGVAPLSLQVTWQGESDPLLPNTSEAHRAKNRRVEICFVPQKN